MHDSESTPVGVFVYGTLRRDQSAFSVVRDAGWVDARPAAVRGFRLYGLPLGWPAAVQVDDDTLIHGELHRFEDLERALAVLDAYEEVDREFQRFLTPVYPEPDHEPIEGSTADAPPKAWIYAYPNMDAVCATGGRPIPGGWWPGPHDRPGHSSHEL